MNGGAGRAQAAISLALLTGVLLALHGPVLGYPFLADDYYFLWETRGGGVESLFGGLAHRPNYYRPLGREIYFASVAGAFGRDPRAFHVVGLALLVAAVGGVMALGGRIAGTRAGTLAAAAYALFYPHRVNLAWASCAQDLLSTSLAIGAALLYLRERRRLAAALFFLALFAKESVAPLPAILLAFELLLGKEARDAAAREGAGARLRRALRRTAPLWTAAMAWAVLVLVARAATGIWNTWHSGLGVADVRPSLGSAWLGVAGAVATLLYVDQPLRHLGPALRQQVPWIAMAGVAAVSLLASRAPRSPRQERAGLVRGLAWLALGLVPVALVGHLYSGYYVTFAAVGFALLVGALLARLDGRVAAVVLVFACFLDAGANATDLYREREDRPGVSQFTAARLRHAASYLEALRRALEADPPDKGSRVYLARMPNHVGFATAESRALWVWTGDSTLSLTVIDTYRPEARERAPRLFRYDESGGRFVPLPRELVDRVMEGESAFAAGRNREARATLLSALAWARPGEHDVERVELLTKIGLAAWRLGDRSAALASWERALTLDPRHYRSLLYRALALWEMGRRSEARRGLERLLSFYPEDEVARGHLKRLDSGASP